MTGLSNNQFYAFKTIHSVMDRAGHSIRLVGGAVRDILMDITPKDLDFATDATPDQVISILNAAGFDTIETGLKHGTVSGIIGDEIVEITTLRSDDETDGRHARVSYVKSWEIDAARRDLTINAMSMDIDMNIHDYFGGVQDLEAKRFRFVGDPAQRIKEDYLRILRYFRFFARFDGATFDKAAAEAIIDNKDGLDWISGERIWAELVAMTNKPNTTEAFKMMSDFGVLSAISPALKCTHYSEGKFVYFDITTLKYKPEHWIAAMIENGEDLVKLKTRLKMSANSYLTMLAIINGRDVPFTKEEVRRRLARGASFEWNMDVAIDKFHIPIIKMMEDYRKNPPVFPISGTDVMNKGHIGRTVGNVLDELKNAWADSEWTMTREELLERIPSV